MIGKGLDETTATLSRNAILFDGETLAQRAELLHMDCERLGRLLQLPAEKSVQQQSSEFDLWSTEKLDAVL